MQLWFFVSTSVVLAIGAIIPYVKEILRSDKAKPKIVTWLIWTVLTGIGCIASFTEGQIPSGVLTLAMTLQTGTVVVLLLVKRADRTLETLDKWCSVGAVVGLILWPVFNSPTVTIVAMITIDIVGAVPTVRNAWQYPHEEKWVTFLLTGLASAAALVAVGSWEISALAYPLYLLLLYTTLVLVILTSQRRSNSKDTATADLLQ